MESNSSICSHSNHRVAAELVTQATCWLPWATKSPGHLTSPACLRFVARCPEFAKVHKCRRSSQSRSPASYESWLRRTFWSGRRLFRFPGCRLLKSGLFAAGVENVSRSARATESLRPGNLSATAESFPTIGAGMFRLNLNGDRKGPCGDCKAVCPASDLTELIGQYFFVESGKDTDYLGAHWNVPQAEQRNIKFVIASLPDPIHTHMALLFDRDSIPSRKRRRRAATCLPARGCPGTSPPIPSQPTSQCAGHRQNSGTLWNRYRD